MMSSLNNGIYELDNLPFSSREFHKKFTFVSGPLSLFDAEDNPDQGNENPDVERPLTPVEEAIKGPPVSFSSFAKLIRPRLTPKDVVPGLSMNDQQELIGVIMNEINNIWGDMKGIPPDPFLSHQQNIELQRRLAIEIVTLAQGLFVQFLEKAQKLHHLGVFSSSANMSRLKTQLALDANKSFNVLSIRRNLAMDMKNPFDGSTVSSFMKIGGTHRSYKPLVVRQEEGKTKLRLTKEELLQRRMENEIIDLQKQMPSMNPDYYYGMFPQEVLMKTKKTPSSVAETEQSEIQSVPLVGITIEEQDYLNEKCISEPYLPVGESLLEELGISQADIDVGRKGLPRSNSVDKIQESIDQHELDGRVSVKEPEPGTPDYTTQDLKRLLASRSGRSSYEKLQDEKETGALPPLLQALAHHKKRDKKQDDFTDLNKMDENCSETGSVIGSTKASSIAVDPCVIDDSITEFTGEEHPQPAVVSLRLPDKSVVRTSDVRLSNRVNKSSLVLQKYPTIYNDLTGEIDAPTVKWLDRNLFIGEEIKEVYQEIIRTMNTDHLLFDKDPYVEKCAIEVDLSLCNASTSLLKSTSERIMNSKLHREIPPPWGVDTADSWRNNPKFGGLGREDILQAKIGKDGDGGTNSKSYNSWLAWWRSTINFDDYLKYVSTQDNDFLTMLYHLYDSEPDSDDEGPLDEIRPDTVQHIITREREKVLAELKAKKTEYKSGFWNANSVLLGGLGQDPVIEEEELLSTLAPDRSSGYDRRTLSQASQQSNSSDKKSCVSSSTKDSRQLTATSVQTKSEVSRGQGLSFQDRLERLWTLLCMPDVQRLDMAIKYSGDAHKHKLGDALNAWEAATAVIIDRESLLIRLEDFERKASDPNRFFERGEASTSLSRIRESKIRDSFDKQLSELSREVKHTVMFVKKQFGDDVTFQGRPCLEKLRHDRTEMLYWLQQERRQQVLNREVLRVREVSFTSMELPPLSCDTLL